MPRSGFKDEYAEMDPDTTEDDLDALASLVLRGSQKQRQRAINALKPIAKDILEEL